MNNINFAFKLIIIASFGRVSLVEQESLASPPQGKFSCFIKKEEGATSIFVMILMVVLIVFGLAALTTSLASLKLSGKNSAWTKEYYLLEAEAEYYLALIDQQLIEAREEAREESKSDLSQYLAIYYEKVWVNLGKLSSEKPVIKLLEEHNSVTFTVTEKKEAFPKNISVKLNILEPSFDESERNKQNRFAIIQWKEWQNQFEYDQDINFENPNFENPSFEDSDLQESEDQESASPAPLFKEPILDDALVEDETIQEESDKIDTEDIQDIMIFED